MPHTLRAKILVLSDAARAGRREDRSGPAASALMALNMMVDTRGGQSYTFSELREILLAAGFRAVQRRPLFSAAKLVIARK